MKLGELLKKHNFKFSKKYGQNFLSDGNLLESIATKSGVDSNTPVLEIGCGAGTLTKVLCQHAKYVYGYEIDKTLAPVLGDNLRGIENCDITFKDIMREKTQETENRIGEQYMLVANLPYYITTPIIMKFVEESKNCKAIVIMVQEEVARRICAKAGTADYGAITASINLVADSEIILRVPRTMFMPAPSVDSAVVKIVFNQNKYVGVDRKIYRDTVRTAFLSRRKTLVNNLREWLKIDKTSAENLLLDCNIDIMARGETLTEEDFVRLSAVVKQRYFNS
ncbi:MAG: ribosomal RNA small subunit methyltransferase A [Clostridia bacterium]|nr:ribosomal RNA small subunit methyltransferase A [Clostridia bacterium]